VLRFYKKVLKENEYMDFFNIRGEYEINK